MSVDVLRQLMGVDEYPLYQDFRYLNARVIKPAVKQINEATSIHVEVRMKRVARRITELQFLVSPNSGYDGPMIGASQPKRRKVRLTEKRERLLLDLRAYGIQDGKARDLLALYSDRHLHENFAYVKDQVARGGIDNKAGFAIWAIERDAANVAALEDRESRRHDEKRRQKRLKAEQDAKHRRDNGEVDTRIETTLASMSESDRERLNRSFETWLQAHTRNPLTMFKTPLAKEQIRRVEYRRFMLECVLDD